CKIVKCSTSHIGQSESLRKGIQMAQDEGMNAVLVILADQPFITVRMLNEMIECMQNNQKSKFVATSTNEMIMPPVLFASSMFPELLNLRGDTGARAILKGD